MGWKGKDLLTAKAIDNAEIPKDKPRGISDGAGLFLEIQPSGKKRWFFRFRLQGKDSELSLGSYPEVPLRGFKHHDTGIWIKGARDLRDEYRTLVAAGVNPAQVRRDARKPSTPPPPPVPQNTFLQVALAWHDKHRAGLTPSYGLTNLRRLEAYIFPVMGDLEIESITTSMLFKALKTVEDKGAIETAHRVRSICGMVFDYAIQTGLTEKNPATNLRGALRTVPTRHLSSITDPVQVGGLLRACDSYIGGVVVRCALRLAPLVFVRPGELRQAEWGEVDFENALWSIPAERMKMREPHLVPLSRQAVEMLREVHPFTKEARYVFPSPTSPARPMSNNAILGALRRMGYDRDEMSGHGFRAMARTILDEVLEFPVEYIEQQLAHAVRDPLGRAYNRTKHLPQRREMMQRWADYLDELRSR